MTVTAHRRAWLRETAPGYLLSEVRLAEARRDRVRLMPIFESPLLFARTNVPSRAREMRPDGTVVEV